MMIAQQSREEVVYITPQDTQVTSSFWTGRIKAVREGALAAIYNQMKETGRWDNLKLKWKDGDPNKPHRFWDSDIAKWLEAACYSLITHPDAALAQLVEEAVDLIRDAQQEDGYINSYYTVVEPRKRWTNIAWSHEMYCAGHLLEAGLAHYEYTHSMRLLGPLLKYIEHIRSVFGPEENQKHGYPGHQILEMALLRAYETLGDKSLLDLARYFIEERGQKRVYDGVSKHYYDVEATARGDVAFVGPMRRAGDRFEYMQADKPLREMAKEGVRGHSVRTMYWLAAVAGLARLAEDEDGSVRNAAIELWKSTTERKMYVTGGLGAIGEWEGFGPDYFFPNETGYLETCASIGLVFFAHQMLLLDPSNSTYAGVLERALYNGVLVGMSLDGKGFFYDNPLATLEQDVQRSEWFEVACCPPNVARLLGSLGKYIYTLTTGGLLYVHLYISSTVDVWFEPDRVVKVVQVTDDWSGDTTFTFIGDVRDVRRIRLGLRRPTGVHWWEVMVGASEFQEPVHSWHLEVLNMSTFTLNLAAHTANHPSTQTSLTLTVRVVYAYKPRVIYPHLLDSENRGCVAFARGPFIYCLESTDNEGISDLRAIRVYPNTCVEQELDSVKFKKWGLEVIALTVKGVAVSKGREQEKELTLIPYFAWANRGKSDLRMWLPVAQ